MKARVSATVLVASFKIGCPIIGYIEFWVDNVRFLELGGLVRFPCGYISTYQVDKSSQLFQSYRQDPNYRIAIAEGREGHREPVIILYTWPQMEMDAVLRDGTSNAYSILDFRYH